MSLSKAIKSIETASARNFKTSEKIHIPETAGPCPANPAMVVLLNEGLYLAFYPILRWSFVSYERPVLDEAKPHSVAKICIV